MLQTHDSLKPDTVLAGRYRIQWQIGQGGMGAVYAAFDERLARPVAIKVLLDTHRQDEEAVLRFEREAVATAAIRHPGIVQIFDQGREGLSTFVVMERLEGEDLSALIERESPLSIARLTEIGIALAEALSAAHAAAIVHRDLKPSNVFMARTHAGGHTVKVLDFGIAKMLAAAQALTRTNQVFGTLRYMSPEQVTNSKDVGTATDVFALGVILYEMLTGRVPHEGKSKLEVTYQILNDAPTPPRELRSSVPEALDGLLLACLCKQPEARPRAQQIGHALRDLLDPAPARAAIVALPPPIVVSDRPSSPRTPDNSTLRLGFEATDSGEEPDLSRGRRSSRPS